MSRRSNGAPRYRKRSKKDRPFRRGSKIERKQPRKKRERSQTHFTDESGQVHPVTPRQQRRGVSVGDVARVGLRHVGAFRSNLATGLSKAQIQIQSRPEKPSQAPLIKAELVEPAIPPIGAMQNVIDTEIMRDRPLGLPHIIDKEDVITPKQEKNLQDYVREAMGAMPVGTDTSVEPIITVVPRDQFRGHLVATGSPHPQSPAMTTSRNQILVSDALFDMSEDERRAVVLHESLHALRGHAELISQGQMHPSWAEKEASEFETRLEPEGHRKVGERLFGHPHIFGGS